jgi:hypothetical protein
MIRAREPESRFDGLSRTLFLTSQFAGQVIERLPLLMAERNRSQ